MLLLLHLQTLVIDTDFLFHECCFDDVTISDSYVSLAEEYQISLSMHLYSGTLSFKSVGLYTNING